MVSKHPHSSHLRRGRFSKPGNYYFLTATTADRRQVFAKPENAILVLDAIRWLDKEMRFYVDAAVVMPDHFHIAGQLNKSTLEKQMHSLKSYTATLLSQTGVAPPVWQKGYHDHALRDSDDYNINIRYLIENPLRAGLVDRAEDYPYLILPAWWK